MFFVYIRHMAYKYVSSQSADKHLFMEDHDMKLIKVAAAALNQTPLDWAHNSKNIIDAIKQARSEGVGILCLPELCISGYGCEDAFLSPALHETAMQVLHEILPHTSDIVVSLGLPLNYQNGLYNAACLAVNGRIAGFAAKRFLAGQGIHYEPRWFKAWPENVRGEIKTPSGNHPVGDLLFDIGGVRIGFEICEDAWVPCRPGSKQVSHGVDVILNPSASHFAFGKFEVRKRFVLEGSRAFGVSYVFANMLGNEAGRAIYDGETLIASDGKLLAVGPRFSFRDFRMSSALVDLDRTRLSQVSLSTLEQDIENAPHYRVAADFPWPDLEPQKQQAIQPGWENSPHIKEEEFARAEALALFDYMRKSRSRGYVVSLSGGADSSAISCLIYLMTRFGTDELGLEGLKNKLSHIPSLNTINDVSGLMHELLTCAYQSTRNSGSVTRNAARGLAEAIGASFFEFDVDALVSGYVGMIENAIGRKLSWENDDLALQNIQARVRAPSVWLLANIRGALLLATSNRSEAAVGYATMDGDTSGGLAPIGGIDKAFLRRWLEWLEKTGPQNVGNIPALSAVTCQAPTAELRPGKEKQTDEKDLMPYDVLDEIERLSIRDKKSPLEIFKLLRPQFKEAGDAKLYEWIERFFRLWCRNQWKRERYAPSFHLDDENLDPKTWCRFPILSGGFERELAQLREYLNRKS